MEGGIGIKGLLTLYSVFDLAGYYADLGLGVEAEFAYHDLENGSLACEDIKVISILNKWTRYRFPAWRCIEEIFQLRSGIQTASK